MSSDLETIKDTLAEIVRKLESLECELQAVRQDLRSVVRRNR